MKTSGGDLLINGHLYCKLFTVVKLIYERRTSMLKSFSVEYFRGFSSKITFDLTAKEYSFNPHLVKNGLVNKGLIYGPNGIGKTNLGVAIFDITRHLSDNQRLPPQYVSDFTNLDHADSPVSFAYEFKFGTDIIEYSYKKKGIDNLLEEHIKVNGKQYLDYNYFSPEKCRFAKDLVTPQYFNLIDNRLSVTKFIYLNTPGNTNAPLRNLVDFVDRMLWFRSLSEGNNYCGFTIGSSSLSELIYRRNALPEFQAFLAKFGINYKLEFTTLNGQHEIRAIFGKNRALFTNIASTGTKTLWLYFFWKKEAFEKASFVFIDEFDAFLHYEAAESLVKAIGADDNFQSVMTTHNIALMKNSLTRPDCNFKMSENKIISLSDATNRELREGNNIEKLIRAGEFDDAEKDLIDR